jgi:hypothetical protein
MLPRLTCGAAIDAPGSTGVGDAHGLRRHGVILLVVIGALQWWSMHDGGSSN